jgi:thiol:disulfide interchange protein DsbD
MAGVFEIGTSLTSVGSGVQKKGYSGSFFSGILTTLIATPCSGPFLGAAMGYTLAQPPGIALFLFTVFALGISSPYLLLSCYPSLIAKLPRPGEWMETFKITMAFALFATVAFFARTFGAQTGVRGLSWLVMALVVIGLAMFIYGQWSPGEVKAGRRFAIGYGLAGLILALGGYMCYDAAGQKGEVVAHGEWETWEPGKVEYTLAQNNSIVWVDYTAEW